MKIHQIADTGSISTKVLYTAGLGIGVTMLSGASYMFYKYWKKDEIPLKWKRVGTLEKINIFPTKSCAPLKLREEDVVACDVLGLRLDNFRDRALMIIDVNNDMITARVYPKMVLIETKKIGPSKLLFAAPHMSTQLELDFATVSADAPGKDVHTAVWGTPLDAMLCGDVYDKWFSECILGKPEGLHLVYYPYPKPVRSTNSRLAKEPFIKQEDSVGFYYYAI